MSEKIRSRTVAHESGGGRAKVIVAIAAVVTACGGSATGGDGGRSDGSHADADAHCAADRDCDDGRFCNGAERCSGGSCSAGTPPCTGGCDEAVDGCGCDGSDADADGHASVECGGDDCDDGDATRFPGNVEVCDDEARDEDCDPVTFGFRDADGDRWPDARCCNRASDGASNCGSDCEDTFPSVHPSEAETCDGLDNDCDGDVDEDVTRTFYADADGDMHGDASGATTEGCFAPSGYVAGPLDDCDDAEAATHPGAIERCVGTVDEDCDGDPSPPELCNCSPPDSRGCLEPGICASGTQDCVEGAWGACSIAGRPETCNGLDDDCDGAVDEGVSRTCFGDDDNDTYAELGAAPSSACRDAARAHVGECPDRFTDRPPVGAGGIDCDDADPGRFPGALEACDGVDQSCNGIADDGLLVSCWIDADRDGYAASGAALSMLCPGPGGGCPSGYSPESPVGRADCDDTNAARSPAVVEVCNAIDDDCDGAVDDGARITCYADVDGDGYAPASATPELVCAEAGGACPAGRTPRAPIAGATDCADTDPTRTPATPEICNGIDDDRDGAVDDGLGSIVRYRDADGDGFGDSATAVTTCPGLPGYVNEGGDCRDDLPNVNPGQIGYHSTPACPLGSTSCTAADSRIGCRPVGGGTCDPSAGHWDYDCSGGVDFDHVRAGPCDFVPGTGTGCLAICRAEWDGYVYDAGTANDCGREVPLAYCHCSMLGASSSCDLTGLRFDTVTLQCR